MRIFYTLIFLLLFTCNVYASSFGVIRDTGGETANVDSVSGSLQTINFEHHELHDGNSYEVHVTSANLAVAGLNVAFKTVNTTELVHILIGWHSNDEISFEIIEGATWTQGTGTARNYFAHNRTTGDGAGSAILEDKNQASFTDSEQVIQDVTGIAGGTVIDLQYTYNAGAPASLESESREAGHEWYLKADTTYIIRLTETDADCKMTIDLHWYEHIPKN